MCVVIILGNILGIFDAALLKVFFFDSIATISTVVTFREYFIKYSTCSFGNGKVGTIQKYIYIWLHQIAESPSGNNYFKFKCHFGVVNGIVVIEVRFIFFVRFDEIFDKSIWRKISSANGEFVSDCIPSEFTAWHLRQKDKSHRKKNIYIRKSQTLCTSWKMAASGFEVAEQKWQESRKKRECKCS